MAEKNSAQANKQTDRQTNTDTTKIMVTWTWTNNTWTSGNHWRPLGLGSLCIRATTFEL